MGREQAGVQSRERLPLLARQVGAMHDHEIHVARRGLERAVGEGPVDVDADQILCEQAPRLRDIGMERRIDCRRYLLHTTPPLPHCSRDTAQTQVMLSDRGLRWALLVALLLASR